MGNPERLIGKKVKGFKFEKLWYLQKMDNYIGKIGTIKQYDKNEDWCIVEFDEDGFAYPANQIEAHLVEDEDKLIKGNKYIQQDGVVILAGQSETSGTVVLDPKNMWGLGYFSDDWNPKAFTLFVEDEIPTLSDGVMMLVSDNEERWHKRKVIGKRGIKTIAWYDEQLVSWTYCKPLEPTKEEQLTAILGSDEKVKEIMELFKN